MWTHLLLDGTKMRVELVYCGKPSARIVNTRHNEEQGVMECDIEMPMPNVKITVEKPDGGVQVYENGKLVESYRDDDRPRSLRDRQRMLVEQERQGKDD